MTSASNVPFDTNDKDKPRLGRDVIGATLFGGTSKADLLALHFTVFLDIFFGALEDDTTFLLVRLYKTLGKPNKKSDRRAKKSCNDSAPKDG